MDFGLENGAKLVPKTNEKLMSTCKSDFSTDVGFASVKPILFRVSGIKNRSKRKKKSIKKRIQNEHRKRMPKNLIFSRFWWFLGGKLGSKIDQKSMRKVI